MIHQDQDLHLSIHLLKSKKSIKPRDVHNNNNNKLTHFCGPKRFVHNKKQKWNKKRKESMLSIMREWRVSEATAVVTAQHQQNIQLFFFFDFWCPKLKSLVASIWFLLVFIVLLGRQASPQVLNRCSTFGRSIRATLQYTYDLRLIWLKAEYGIARDCPFDDAVGAGSLNRATIQLTRPNGYIRVYV